MTVQRISDVRALLERHGLSPRKTLGQHFLADGNITRKIVQVADVGPDSNVVEVGVGTGTLTLGLVATGARVVAYEVDESLRPLLADVFADFDVDLRFADAARVDFNIELGEGDWTMVANLPYNVGTPILLDAVRHAPAITRFVVMVQLEVAQRLAAGVGDPAYGLPSVIVGLHGSARILFRVPPTVFLPPPAVGSAVIEVVRRTPHVDSTNAVRLAAAGFGKRRKMLRGSLAAVIEDPVGVLEAAGIAPTARAEELAPDEWRRLAEAAS